MIEMCIGQCLLKIDNDGDVQKLRMLLEIPFGKLPEESQDFETTEEERSIILAYRKRLEENSESRTIENSSDQS